MRQSTPKIPNIFKNGGYKKTTLQGNCKYKNEEMFLTA
jgi:hypothetical protein